MSFEIIIIYFILWNVIAGLEGFVRAHYEDYVYFSNRNHPNLHPWYFFIRGLILFPMFCDVSYFGWINAGIFVIACASAYSLWYDGILYTWRNNLAPEIYKKRFFEDKEKGEDKNSSLINMSFRLRLAFFMVAVFFIIGIILDIIHA